MPERTGAGNAYAAWKRMGSPTASDRDRELEAASRLVAQPPGRRDARSRPPSTSTVKGSFSSRLFPDRWS